jgi:hypothetical protein
MSELYRSIPIWHRDCQGKINCRPIGQALNWGPGPLGTVLPWHRGGPNLLHDRRLQLLLW